MHDLQVCTYTFSLLPHPAGKLHGVGDGGREHNDSDVVRQHDEDLLPHYPPLQGDNTLELTWKIHTLVLFPNSAHYMCKDSIGLISIT